MIVAGRSMMFNKTWRNKAREEGRLCRICKEPVSKHFWNNAKNQHLCYECFIRESELPHDTRFKLAKEYKENG